MSRIELTEFEERGPIALTDEEVLLLQEQHSKHIDIKRDGDCFSLKPRNYVGFITLPERIIYIKPKIPDDNLMFIISYLYDQVDLGEDIYFSDRQTDSILDIMAFILTSWAGKLIKKGLHRKYIKKQERIPRVRGKIIPLKNLFHYDRIHCEFDELSHSIYENVILKATLRLILTIPVLDEIKNYARTLVMLLAEIENRELEERLFQRIHYTRLNKNYVRIIDLCYLIYKNYALYQASHKLCFPGFLIDMNAIFEEFVRKLLIRNLPEEKISKKHIREWASGIDLALLPEMKPDIVIDGRLVIDVKYYRDVLSSKGKLRSDHIYQILSYMKVLGLNGMLVYPQVIERYSCFYDVSDGFFQIETVDLSGTRSELKQNLNKFINGIRVKIKPMNEIESV